MKIHPYIALIEEYNINKQLQLQTYTAWKGCGD
jgi:hypothetical protein